MIGITNDQSYEYFKARYSENIYVAVGYEAGQVIRERFEQSNLARIMIDNATQNEVDHAFETTMRGE
jgi:hypothetical protein